MEVWASQLKQLFQSAHMLEVGLSTRRHEGFQDDQRDYGKDDVVAEIALRIRQGVAEPPQGLFVDEIAMGEN